MHRTRQTYYKCKWQLLLFVCSAHNCIVIFSQSNYINFYRVNKMYNRMISCNRFFSQWGCPINFPTVTKKWPTSVCKQSLLMICRLIWSRTQTKFTEKNNFNQYIKMIFCWLDLQFNSYCDVNNYIIHLSSIVWQTIINIME